MRDTSSMLSCLRFCTILFSHKLVSIDRYRASRQNMFSDSLTMVSVAQNWTKEMMGLMLKFDFPFDFTPVRLCASKWEKDSFFSAKDKGASSLRQYSMQNSFFNTNNVEIDAETIICCIPEVQIRMIVNPELSTLRQYFTLKTKCSFVQLWRLHFTQIYLSTRH